jgi:hypothetical protein
MFNLYHVNIDKGLINSIQIKKPAEASFFNKIYLISYCASKAFEQDSIYEASALGSAVVSA